MVIPKSAGQLRVEDVFRAGHLDFQVMVPRAQRADLVETAVDGFFADLPGIRPLDAAGLLGALQVLLPPVAVPHAPPGAFLHHPAELAPGDLEKPGAPHPGRHPLIEPVDQLLEVRFDLVIGEVGGDQAHAAVDVETDPARRDDPFLRVHGRHSSDGKAVAEMAVGHAQGIPGDPREGGHIGDLVVDRLVHFLNELLRGVDAGRNPHPFLVRGGHFPDRLGNLLEIPGNGHNSVPWVRSPNAPRFRLIGIRPYNHRKQNIRFGSRQPPCTPRPGSSSSSSPRGISSSPRLEGKDLVFLAPVPVDGDPLALQPIGRKVDFANILDGGFPGQVDRLGDRIVRISLKGRLGLQVLPGVMSKAVTKIFFTSGGIPRIFRRDPDLAIRAINSWL